MAAAGAAAEPTPRSLLPDPAAESSPPTPSVSPSSASGSSIMSPPASSFFAAAGPAAPMAALLCFLALASRRYFIVSVGVGGEGGEDARARRGKP